MTRFRVLARCSKLVAFLEVKFVADIFDSISKTVETNDHYTISDLDILLLHNFLCGKQNCLCFLSFFDESTGSQYFLNHNKLLVELH